MNLSAGSMRNDPPVEENDEIISPSIVVGRGSSSSSTTSASRQAIFREAISSDKLQSHSSTKSTSTHSSGGLKTVSDDFCDISPRTSASDDESDTETCESMRELFKKSYEYIRPSAFFRYVVGFYADRKLLVVFWIHFVTTMLIWCHFSLVKFDQQKNAVPEGAPFYWWKRIAPSLEFGSMHAILFQMALLPLTMARFSIAALSESVLDRFVPLNKAVRMHIHLGYVMVVIVFFATVFFFAFFGLLCAGGEEAFCKKFTSEIMCTGYGILATLLIIGGTSYFRHKMPYELFYIIHHLVFALYIITIAHTFDIAHRNNSKNRSQTFKWFSSTLLYYVCDRAAMHMNHKYRARLVSSSAVTGSNGSKMIILKLRRPPLFQFKPGQYAYLKLSSIDTHWHPFSIASGPSASHLEFYIEVFGEKSWTNKLWSMLEGDGDGGTSLRQIDMEIMGPYGTSLAKTENFSHGLAIGTGTGIVPILSIFKQHVRKLLRLAPERHFETLKEHHYKMQEVEMAEESRKGSIAKQVVGSCHSSAKFGKHVRLEDGGTRNDMVKTSIRDSISRHKELKTGRKMPRNQEFKQNTRKMNKAAHDATKSIYGVVLLGCLPVIGVTVLGLTISWNTINIELYGGMVEFLQAFTVFFQLCFAAIALFVWDGNQLFAYVDVVMCMVTPVADAVWFYRYESQGQLTPGEVTLCCLLTGYMTARVWNMTVKPRHRSWQASVDSDGAKALECLEMVWVARSASLVSEILPDINAIWETLVESWGEENARSVCRISVYVTDKDPVACELLKKDIYDTSLFQSGSVRFGRPDFGRIIEDHSLELVCSNSRRSSYSLLAFCGSPSLAKELHQCKISNDMLMAITGNKKHSMEFVSESYGGVKKEVKSKDVESEEPERHGTLRKTTAYKSESKRFDRELSGF